MSLLGQLISLFPVLLYALCAIAIGLISQGFFLAGLGLFLFTLYLLPPLSFKLHSLCFPIPIGTSSLSRTGYNAWWGTYQIQAIYIAFPSIEGALRIVPGAYSAWLRLWGSKIGKKVHWTPRIEILDRNLLIVGDGCIFGHRFGCSAHVIDVKPEGTMLYVKPITIGKMAFFGAESILPPGTTVPDFARLPARTVLKINEVYVNPPRTPKADKAK